MAKRSAKNPAALPIVLASEGDAIESIGSPGKGGTGEPTQRFRKDVLHVGTLSHPVDGWQADFTPERIAKIAAETNRLIAAGHEPHVPSGHIRYADAATNRGFVKSMRVEGDRLFADMELIGDESIKEASRNKVSVFIEPAFKDGKGNTYGECITHVALTPVPVQTGQGDFVAIAASADDLTKTIDVPVLRLDTGNPNMTLHESIAALTGVAGVKDDTTALAALTQWGEGLKANVAKVETKAASLASEKATLAAEVSTLKGKVKDAPPELSPMTMKLARENREMKLATLVTQGRITPAVRDRLSATWAAKDAAVLALSMDESSDKRFDDMVAALGENDPVKLGEQTKSQQTFALGRTNPDGEQTPRVDPEIEKRSARLTGKKA